MWESVFGESSEGADEGGGDSGASSGIGKNSAHDHSSHGNEPDLPEQPGDPAT
jgi:hypothetical protein